MEIYSLSVEDGVVFSIRRYTYLVSRYRKAIAVKKRKSVLRVLRLAKADFSAATLTAALRKADSTCKCNTLKVE